MRYFSPPNELKFYSKELLSQDEGIVMFQNIFKAFLLLIVLVICIFILTKCKYAEITDIVNETTADLHIKNKEDIKKSEYEDYEYNGVIFKPYFSRTYLDNTDEKEDFSLMLFAFKIDENKKVVLHSVSLEEKNGEGYKIEKDLKNKELFLRKMKMVFIGVDLLATMKIC